MTFITTKDGTKIAYKNWGKGQPILFSHGWPLAGDAWDGQMLFFGQNGYRMLQAGVILSDYATLMVEILKDNARQEAGAVYGAIDMPWAKLVGQIAQAYGK
jgi:pimeloyl-ACP methyl ester carboxylesterase